MRSPLFRVLVLVVAGVLVAAPAGAATPIDRRALVTRHNPRITTVDPWAPLSVGNGGFAFTVDASGLQTISALYHRQGIATETQARWLWHTEPNPQGHTLADTHRPFPAYGRTVGYPTQQNHPAGVYLRRNPHPQPLPQFALEFAPGADGMTLEPAALTDLEQALDLWSGLVTTRYRLAGRPVEVRVACHPAEDTLAITVRSPHVAEGRLGVRLALPRGHDLAVKNNPPLDWSAPESHETRELARSDRALRLEHRRDDSRYVVDVLAVSPWRVEPAGAHAYRLAARAGDTLAFSVRFSRVGAVPAPADGVYAASAEHWPRFWQSGGAIDFSGSRDPRAPELERRVVLSQYLTALQFAGDFPPQETGLTLNSWFGKHHTEMIWWHAAHFALWGRDAYLGRNLDWYAQALPIARRLAVERGLRGARWPKMIGPDGRESPGGNPLIVWNQPHPIHLAELLYRNLPTPATLQRYQALVEETAECLASMLHWDEARQRYNLGPPLWIAQEIYDQATSMNPTYELSYWVRGLKIALEWRRRAGLPPHPAWERCIAHIARLPQKDGRYVAIESVPDTWDNPESRHDHPSFLMAFGQLPGDLVDLPTMHRTLDAVLQRWDWEAKIWGWDYPMIAMTAARLGRPRDAVDVLLKSDSPNNSYTPNGHNRQREDLPVYLPGNGALLAAVAMMAAGWDDGPAHHAPGFPQDGTWVVRHEGLHRLP